MDADDTERTVGYLIKRVQQVLRRHCDAALRPVGLSMAQYAALRALADHPDASTAELARLCFVTRQSLQEVISGLRSEGLVRDASRQARGRAVALALTPAGRARLKSGHEAVLGVDAMMVDELPAVERRHLAKGLLTCAERLERQAPS